MKHLWIALAACGSRPPPQPVEPPDPGTPIENPSLTLGAHRGYHVSGAGTTCMVYPNRALPELETRAKLIYVEGERDPDALEALRVELRIEHLCLLGDAVAIDFARRHPQHLTKLVLYQVPAPADLGVPTLALDHADADAFEKFLR